ncbi:MAG TPA: ABC transporter substrate-binding protein [Gemmatimonadaceae bacterium]|nr:ABC transporter substrate-binding protein [Gemmatimonadaceae bacterium]
MLLPARPLLSRAAPLLLAAALACRGGDAIPDRRTLIDSRDTYDPRSLDPALSTDVPTGRAVSYVFDGLTSFTPDAQLAPGLAERWDVSPDGRVYIFHLRRGVTFHDGTPFEARQVVRSFARVLDPRSRGGRGWPLFPILGARAFNQQRARAIAGLATPDDSTVVITLEEPLAIFPKLLAMPVAAIVPDSTPANFGEHPVGTGPWRFVEWRHDDHLLFVRNERYWGGAPPAESLMARIIPEPGTAVAEFESGRVDLLQVPEGETRQWEQTDVRSARLQTASALRLYYVGINATRGPLRDARVRQAINHAVDVRTILNELIAGRGRVAAGVIPPSLGGADTTRAPYSFDPARAKQLLAEAGHASGFPIDLWVSTSPPFPRIAETIQGYLAEVGIKARIVQRDASSMREAARKGETDLVLKDWFADYPDAENFLYPLLHSANKGVGGNVSFYQNAAFDSLVTRARREQNEPARLALYRQADSLAFADAPLLYLWFYNELYAVQPWITGFQVPTIFNGQRWLNVRIGAPDAVAGR